MHISPVSCLFDMHSKAVVEFITENAKKIYQTLAKSKRKKKISHTSLFMFFLANELMDTTFLNG